jgi:hypothetical protein
MNKESKNSDNPQNGNDFIADVSTSTFKATMPLEMIWQPKEDITTYELAMCLPYFFRYHGVMPYEVDKSLPHFRHFKITDHNVY